MTNRVIAVAQLLVAVATGAGCVLSWRAARSIAAVGPVLAGEPAKTSLVLDPPLIGLALFLAALAGVAVVSAGARLRR